MGSGYNKSIDSYTGFILPRTHDKHQWLLLQFIILLMMGETTNSERTCVGIGEKYSVLYALVFQVGLFPSGQPTKSLFCGPYHTSTACPKVVDARTKGSCYFIK